ncbi:HIT family protein [Dielma fastidiosa]|uniref:HIT family protein n=1 Tax=Dielma fastidiosa TaxID=1034346 RepID=UPI000E494C61|nr:HIT family protein [Dielma fastidiosa]RHM99504.1 HIT family protein [Dielma fastidiosa]
MCIFCSIINKEIPSSCIYEDDQVMAFLDLSQVTKGHTLVVPKKHYDNLLECDDETLAHLIQVVKMLAVRISERLNAQGVNVLNNTHEAAGQTVNHLHFHIIPRYSVNDAVVIQFNESEKQDLDELVKILK